MSLLKKKITLDQFLSDLIFYQLDFLQKHFDKWIVLADESKVLTDDQKKDFFGKAHELMIADIVMGCNLHFCSMIHLL